MVKLELLYLRGIAMIREILGEALTHAKKPLLQHPRIHESLKYLYDSAFGHTRRMEAFVIKGLVKDSGNCMVMLHFGSEGSAHQFASLVYAEINEFLPIGYARTFREVDSLSAMNTPEITAVRIQHPFVREFVKQGYMLLPNVNFTLDMNASMDDIRKRMSRRRRRDIKKIGTFKYSYTICRNDDRDFDLFYFRMYLPFTKGRFGKAVYIKPYLESKTIFKSNGGVIFVKRDEKPLAGILFHIHGRTLHAWSLGIYEDDRQAVEELAGEAALLFIIEWAKTQGIERLDYGVSLPFFRDGIFTYKKEWGMCVNEQRDQPVCALKLNALNECSLSFLRMNPFIAVDGKKLKGVVLIDYKATEAELQQIYSRYFLPHLDSLIIISYYKPSSKIVKRTESPSNEKPEEGLMIPIHDICVTLQKKGFSTEILEH